jgi:hypothetical protein
MEGLVNYGLLRARFAAHEWIVPDSHDFPAPPDMVSFEHFHNRGLAAPAHCFLLGLLYYYKFELQHLNPNGIQHLAAFIGYAKGT